MVFWVSCFTCSQCSFCFPGPNVAVWVRIVMWRHWLRSCICNIAKDVEGRTSLILLFLHNELRIHLFHVIHQFVKESWQWCHTAKLSDSVSTWHQVPKVEQMIFCISGRKTKRMNNKKVTYELMILTLLCAQHVQCGWWQGTCCLLCFQAKQNHFRTSSSV